MLKRYAEVERVRVNEWYTFILKLAYFFLLFFLFFIFNIYSMTHRLLYPMPRQSTSQADNGVLVCHRG